MTRPSDRWWYVLLVTGCVGVALVALDNALTWYERPFAGVLTTGNGLAAGLTLPGWTAAERGVSFPDRVAAIDGRPLASVRPAVRGDTFNEAIAAAVDAGRETVVIELGPNASTRLVAPIRPFDPSAWWLFFFIPWFGGWLYLGAGLIATWLGTGSSLARTFGRLALGAALFLFTVFDTATTHALEPLNLVALAVGPLAWLVLSLRLPDDAPALEHRPWLEPALLGFGALIAGAIVLGNRAGDWGPALQIAWNPFVAFVLVLALVVFIVRFARARGRRRSTMRALLVAMVVPQAFFGVFALLPALGARHLNTAAAGFVAAQLLPLATAYALVRHDLWGSRALLSRIFTRAAVGALACAVAVAVGTYIATALGAPLATSLIAAASGGVMAALLVTFGMRATDTLIFTSRAEYKPTVEQLSGDLISITSPDDVARAIERTIGRWLPCDEIELTPTDSENAPSGERASGSQLKEGPRSRLTLPVAFGGIDLGVLRVGEKRGGALFTEDDVDLLRTIANQGALALAHAHAYQELEERRRQQAAAWRGEREALVETVAAEIAHEVRYPINFFRSVFDRTAAGRPLDGEDVDIGREEVDRLERLVSGLKRMATSRLQRRPVRVVDLCGRAETLLRDHLGGRSLHVDVASDAVVRCDLDQATQVLVNLVANAIQATSPAGNVGTRWAADDRGVELVVWDDGPGFEGNPADLFAPWYTTRPRGTGLGLAITHRLVRAHGWSIRADRQEGETRFVVSIRREDVVTPETAEQRSAVA